MKISHRTLLGAALTLLFALLICPSTALANTAPAVVVKSAVMRPGTTLMDIVFRVNDPDDATVKTRALAFKDGVRSFANVIRPTTFAEGTGDKIGDAILSNTDHTLTWDVAADWSVDLGQIKFEVLAMDGRGLLPFDWITIPATAQNAAASISKTTPVDQDTLNAFLWLYADGDAGLSLSGSALCASSSAGSFYGLTFVNGTNLGEYSRPYLFKKMGLSVANPKLLLLADAARAGQSGSWLASNKNYEGLTWVSGWGETGWGQTIIPQGLNGVNAVAAGGQYGTALKDDGSVVSWGWNGTGATSIPSGLKGVSAIASGYAHSLALQSDGIVVCWGWNGYGQSSAPAGLSNVRAIAAGYAHSLAVKGDGTVTGWGRNDQGQISIPAGLTNVVAVAAGDGHSLALKGDGSVVGWGKIGSFGGADAALSIPAGLSSVKAIAAGISHCLALRNNGTVTGWGRNDQGQISIPAGLTNVVAVAAGDGHSVALKQDGTVVAWGRNTFGQASIPIWLKGVVAIAAGGQLTFVVQKDPP